MKANELPYRCPVCDGRGIIPIGFYTGMSEGAVSNMTPEDCRSCEGIGVVWRKFYEYENFLQLEND